MLRVFRIRNLLLLLALAVLGLAGLLFSYQWWLPHYLPAIMRSLGCEVGRIAWVSSDNEVPGHFRAEAIAYIDDVVEVRVDWLTFPGVLHYLNHRGQVDAGKVAISFASESVPERRGEPVTPADWVEGLADLRHRILPWLPSVEVESIEIAFSPEQMPISINQFLYNGEEASAQVMLPWWSESVFVEIIWESVEQMVWRVRSPLRQLELEGVLDFSDESDASITLDYELKHRSDKMTGRARWSVSVWLPQQLDLKSDVIVLDREWLMEAGLDGLEALQLQAFNFNWDGSRYSGRLGLHGQYAEAELAERVQAAVAFEGNRDAFDLKQLSIQTLWAQVSLSQPIRVRLDDGSILGDAMLTGSVDLDAQSYIDASGQLDVRAKVSQLSAYQRNGKLSFELEGRDVRYQAFIFPWMEAHGVWDGQLLNIQKLTMQTEPDGALSEVHGQVNFQDDSLNLEYVLSLAPDWLNAIFGQSLLDSTLSAKGTLNGTFEQPILNSSYQTRLSVNGLQPVDIEGRVEANGSDSIQLDAQLRSNEAEIVTKLLLAQKADRWEVTCQSLEWRDPERPELKLEAPVLIHWSTETHKEVVGWEARLRVEDFRLFGEDLALSAGFNSQSQKGLHFEGSHLSLRRVNRWLSAALPDYRLEHVLLAFTEFNPQVAGSIDAHLHQDLPGGVQLKLDLNAALSGRGVSVEQILLQMGDIDLLRGSCQIPVVFSAGDADQSGVTFLNKAPLEGQLYGQLDAQLSGWLNEAYGVQLQSGKLRMEMSGSLTHPEGIISLQLEQLTVDPERYSYEFPILDVLDVVIVADSEMLTVAPLKISIREASIEGNFQLPVSYLSSVLSAERKGKWILSLFEGASGELSLTGWEMQNWVDFMPDVMRRTGRLNGRFQLESGYAMKGNLAFEGFALRPTKTLPSVDSISGIIALDGRRLGLSEGGAKVGGHPVNYNGYIDLSDWQQPVWDLDITGKNVPLVRTSEMILRSDLDLTAHTRPDEAPILEGTLKLRQSTLLLEVDPFAPSYEGGVSRKPPYFSMSEPPFGDWRFDLTIEGNRFMRVRSAYFWALLSANFKLGGSFAYPELIGSVRTEEGEVRFPGANLRLNEGEAYIAQSQPDALQLNFKGVTQKSGYVISMELSETLSDPHIQFQSSPELANSEIIRLLVTGSLNGGGLGSAGLYLGQGLLGNSSTSESWADRISFDVGEETSEEGRNTVDVRYDLSDDWYLNGGYDRYDAYNLDLIWSIYRR